MKKTPFYLLVGALTLVACNSSEEKAAAKELKTIDVDYISSTIKPTDDFFLFANENWIKNNPVPSSESRWGSFNELEKENNIKLTAILEEFKDKGGKKGSKEQILGDFYASFINMDARDKMGLSPIKSELNVIQSLNSKTDISKLVADMHKQGISVFFGFGVGQDMKNVEGHISYFGQSGLGLPNRDYYKADTKADIREAYKKHIAEAFKLAKLKDDKAIDVAVANIYRIEDKLADASLRPEEERIPELTYNKYAKTQLVSDFQNFDFSAYLKGVGSLKFDTLIVSNVKFVKQVDKILKEESLDAIKDYLTWHTLSLYMKTLGTDFVNLDFEFHGKTLSGKKEMKPINERAIELITYNTFFCGP